MKNIIPNRSRSAGILFAFILFTLLGGTIGAQTRQFPIDFYISRLNSATFQVFYDPTTNNRIVIDAFNKRNIALNLGLPTTVDGRVMIQTLKDGTERVTVEGRAQNALCYGYNLSPNSPVVMLFGYNQSEVFNRIGPAALGEVQYRTVFAPQPAGTFNPNGTVETLMSTINCEGLLRAGTGYTEGTPGFAHTRQNGLYNTGAKAGDGCPPEKDANCFPSEKIQFKPRGQ